MVGHELGVNNTSVAVGAGYLAPDALGPGLVNVYHLLAVPALRSCTGSTWTCSTPPKPMDSEIKPGEGAGGRRGQLGSVAHIVVLAGVKLSERHIEVTLRETGSRAPMPRPRPP